MPDQFFSAILILNSPGDCAYWSLFGQDAGSFDVISGLETYDFVRIQPLHLSPLWGFGCGGIALL